MNTNQSLFPQNWGEVPEKYRYVPFEQNDYLSGGKMVSIPSGADVSVPGSEVITLPTSKTPVTSAILIGGKPAYLGSYPSMSERQALAVLQQAKVAYNNGKGEWPKMRPQQRIDAIKKVVEAIKTERENVIKQIMWEICKERSLAEDEFDRTITYIEKTIEKYHEMMKAKRRAPRGVGLCVGPFNYPVNEIFEPMFAKLISGNTVIYKHAKYGILLMHPFLKHFQELLPAGVVNTVYGEGQNTITPIMASHQLHCFVFIGSTGVADIIMNSNKQPHGFHSVLGLGAKNVVLITEFTDIDACLAEWVASALTFNGQRCTAGKMFKVHRSKYEELCTKFAAAVDQLQMGMPWDERTQPGPLITPLAETGKVSYMKAFINDAVSKGAIVLTKNEYFGETIMRPVVLGGVVEGMDIYYQEQFGPVVPVSVYDDVEEVVDYIIGSQCGQQIAIYDSTTKGNAERKEMYIDLFLNQVCHIQFNRPCSRGNGSVAFTGRQNSAKGTLSLEDAIVEMTIPVEVSGD